MLCELHAYSGISNISGMADALLIQAHSTERTTRIARYSPAIVRIPCSEKNNKRRTIFSIWTRVKSQFSPVNLREINVQVTRFARTLPSMKRDTLSNRKFEERGTIKICAVGAAGARMHASSLWVRDVGTAGEWKRLAWPVITRVALMHRVATDNDFLRRGRGATSRAEVVPSTDDASRHPSRFLSDNVAFKTVY